MTEMCGVQIQAGLPGLPHFEVDNGKFPYPDTTVDIAKVLHERDIPVTFEHDREKRQYASLNAADIWLPIVQVTYELLLAVDAHLFASVIIDALGLDRAKRSQLHVEYRATDRKGKEQILKIDGSGKDVLEAIDKFERRMIE